MEHQTTKPEPILKLLPAAQLGGEGAPFFENQKKCPDFGKKCLDSVHA